MKRIKVAALIGASVLLTGVANAQQGVDFSKVEIKTTDLGNKTYMLEGQGGNITVAVGTDASSWSIVNSRRSTTRSRPHHKNLAAADQVSDQHALPRRPRRRKRAVHKEGATIVGHDNLRVRLAAGTTNLFNGNKTPPAPAGAIPTVTYQVGDMKVETGGRVAELKHVINAHTDGDTWSTSPTPTFSRWATRSPGDATPISTGAMAAASKHGACQRSYLKAANDTTKIVPGHGSLATKADLQDFRNMLATARDRVKKLYDEGKTEQQVMAMIHWPISIPNGPSRRGLDPAQLPAQRVQLVPQSQ